MKLGSRLALISLLALSLPLFGWQMVRSLEKSLRDSYQQALIDTARSVAAEISTLSAALPDAGAIYVHQAEEDIVVDGYSSEWTAWLDEAQPLGDDRGSDERADVIAAERRGRLHLFIRVRDSELVLSQPDGSPGDRVELEFATPERSSTIVIAPFAPGWMQAHGEAGGARVQAALQPNERGWTLEAAIKAPGEFSALGLRILDVDARGSGDSTRIHAFSRPRELTRPRAALADRLAALLPEGTRGWVTGPDGWIVARARRDGASPPPAAAASDEGWLFDTAAARLLGVLPDASPNRGVEQDRLDAGEFGDVANANWYQLPTGRGFVVSAGAPILRDGRPAGHVVIERPADRFMARAYRSLMQLFLFGLVGMLSVAAVLIGFAARLSTRIRRLRNAAESAVGRDGRVHGRLPVPRGSDEIADLARSLSGMVERQRQHQDYLQTLASTLSHELRTPLAMIRTSLDNLAEVETPEDRARYRQRAEAGCLRLQRMFQSMSQAARIEESLAEESLEPMDLAELVERYVAGCRETFTGRRFAALVPKGERARIEGSPEQLAQLLDKLVENAVEFSPEGSRITLRVAPQGAGICLQVDNTGSRLPEGRPERLFDSMVSSRSGAGEDAHLGLGLHIVRLIAERHGARVRAFNRPDGVRFQVDFPRPAA